MNRIRHYLDHYAEPDAIRIAGGCRKSFDQAIVVPAYGERDNVLRLLGAFSAGESSLVILVINSREDSPNWVRDSNRWLAEKLESTFPLVATIPSTPPARLLGAPFGHLLVIDCVFPPRQGVGLARRLGFDVALALSASGRLSSPAFATTDADALPPSDYLKRSASAFIPGVSALVFPFEHVPDADPELAEAITVYEAYLRYWTRGLASAGSPWAHHTIGSTVAVDADSYASVRGFPRRMAGEDFYILAKLAKVGRIVAPAGPPILLEGRASERVPFGTGRAVVDQLERRRRGEPEWPVDHPAAFSFLREIILELEGLALEDRTVSPSVASALDLVGGLPQCRLAISGSTDLAVRRRTLHTWLDARRTFKLIRHFGRAANVPTSIREALSSAPFLKFEAGSSLFERLARLRLEEPTGVVGGLAPPALRE